MLSTPALPEGGLFFGDQVIGFQVVLTSFKFYGQICHMLLLTGF